MGVVTEAGRGMPHRFLEVSTRLDINSFSIMLLQLVSESCQNCVHKVWLEYCFTFEHDVFWLESKVKLPQLAIKMQEVIIKNNLNVLNVINIKNYLFTYTRQYLL